MLRIDEQVPTVVPGMGESGASEAGLSQPQPASVGGVLAVWQRRRRGRGVCGCLVALGLAVIGAASAEAGSPFSSTMDAFVALFPSPPSLESTSVNLAGAGSVSLRLYRVDEPQTQWLIGATDVAGLALDRRRALSGARAAVVERSGGALAGERPVRIGPYDGLELRLERPDKAVVRARVCVTPRRIFEVIVMTTEEARRLPQIERFMESFSPE
jgi:hypothetical protein